MTAMAEQDVRAQHMVALDHGNAIRSAMREIRDEVKALAYADGCDHVAALLAAEPGDALGAIRFSRLLRAIRRVGQTHVNEIVKAAGLGMMLDHRIREMTPRQRNAVADELRTRAAAYRYNRGRERRHASN